MATTTRYAAPIGLSPSRSFRARAPTRTRMITCAMHSTLISKLARSAWMRTLRAAHGCGPCATCTARPPMAAAQPSGPPAAPAPAQRGSYTATEAPPPPLCGAPQGADLPFPSVSSEYYCFHHCGIRSLRFCAARSRAQSRPQLLKVHLHRAPHSSFSFAGNVAQYLRRPTIHACKVALKAR